MYPAAIIFIASIIRGYSGFGFAMICAIALSFLYSPSVITPLLLCLDITASVWLFLKTRKLVDWGSLRLLLCAAVVILPMGSLVLMTAPVNLLKGFISLTVILLCLGLLIRKPSKRPPGKVMTIFTGMLSGFLTGVAAIGGPPVILFYLSSDRRVAVSRATMIAYFFVIDGVALVSCAWNGLLDMQVFGLWIKMLIPLGAGIWLGNHLFKACGNEEKFKKNAIFLLMGLALVSLGRSLGGG